MKEKYLLVLMTCMCESFEIVEMVAYWGWDRLTPNRMLISTLRHPE